MHGSKSIERREKNRKEKARPVITALRRQKIKNLRLAWASKNTKAGIWRVGRTIAHACDPKTLEIEAGRDQI